MNRQTASVLWLAVWWAQASGLIAQEAPAEKLHEVAAAAVATPTQASIEELTRRVSKSVVVITSGSRDGRRDGIGTGFIISADGLIATNYHVLGEGRSVRIQTADGRTLEATGVHASDRNLDLAILRVDGKELPALELGDSDAAQQGQAVIALGNPQGLKYSVVSGIISSVREVDGRQMIQLAIPIEPGNSGGPLVDMQGRVLGVLTMKSLVTPNLGFAMTVNRLKPLLEKPNPIPMSRWLTIGALDPREWQPLFGARWRQRAGRVTVEGTGTGFGGRSLCLWQGDVPDEPFELAVTVQLGDESGAAGLAFGSDGDQRHWGFYPTAGRLRLTRFDGPDVTSWSIVHDQPHRAYVAGGWNTLRVRLEDGKATCFVNDEKVVEQSLGELAGKRVGLAKFRDTKAQFREFRVGRELPKSSVPPETLERIAKLVADLPQRASLDNVLVDSLAADAAGASRVLRDRAASLDRQAAQLRTLAQSAHERRVTKDLTEALDGEEEKIDLFRAGLLVALLDNEEVDVEAYGRELARMAQELTSEMPADATDEVKLAALRKYLFEENGFHGSRGDYYSRANSYLNEVLDDREGLPITLSIVYMELARRLGLKVDGVALPGHFIVRYTPAEGEPQLIDVYEGATIVARDEANRRVKEATERDLKDDDLKPPTKRAIIARMLHNLLGVSGGDPAPMRRYLNAIVAIEPESAEHRWLRAIVDYRLEDFAGATMDVEWLLDHEPAGIDLDRVRELQRVLKLQAETVAQ